MQKRWEDVWASRMWKKRELEDVRVVDIDFRVVRKVSRILREAAARTVWSSTQIDRAT